mgnify:CR=1 FL=1
MTYLNAVGHDEHVAWLEIEVADLLGVAIAQRRNQLGADDASFGHARPSPARLHSSEPVDEAAAGAALHGNKAHVAARPVWLVLVQKGDETHNVFVL